jgi:DNA mismatch endonuclease (patch repair protein)
VSRIERSQQMALVRSKNTKPEMLVRRLVHGMGYRYRLHQADLPGRPDLVFRSQRKVVFIHGCFWHGHKCKLGRMPKSRLEYWKPKIKGNKERDARTLRRLRSMRWRALVLWECQLKDLDAVSRLISDKICGQPELRRPRCYAQHGHCRLTSTLAQRCQTWQSKS